MIGKQSRVVMIKSQFKRRLFKRLDKVENVGGPTTRNRRYRIEHRLVLKPYGRSYGPEQGFGGPAAILINCKRCM